MKKLLNGVQKFQSEVFESKRSLFETLTSEGQQPHTLFITCSDSRIDPFLITQSEPGELFVLRNAGNIVPPYTGVACGVAASIEYAVSVLRVQDIVVCGHSQCGAMAHVVKHDVQAFDPKVPMVSQWLRYADVARVMTVAHGPQLSEAERVGFAIESNVVSQLKNLETHPVVAKGLSTGELETHGWVYHLNSGALDIYDKQKTVFTRLQNVSRDIINV